MSEFSRPAQEFLETSRKYADAKADEVKLQVVKGLSVSLSKLVSMLIIVLLGGAAIIVLSIGLIFLIGELIHSYALAAIGVAILLAILTLILYLRKDVLLKDSFVPVFIKLFFPEKEEDSDEDKSDNDDKTGIQGD